MNRGGLETMKMNIYRRVDKTKLQFDFLVSQKGAFDDEIRQLGGRIYYISFIDKVGPFHYAKHLRDFFQNHPEYSVIHIQMDKFGGFIAKQAKKANVPHRLIHSNNTESDGNILVRAVKEYYGRYVNNATNFLACGVDAANWMFKDVEKVKYLKNGVDTLIFSSIDKRDRSTFTVGHIGRFNKVKNHDFLLDIFYELHKKEPNSRLVLVGDGPKMSDIQTKAKALKLVDSIEFVGLVSEVAPILQRMDVFCMPSLHEGFPVTLVEAQACGVPCVVSDSITEEVKILKDDFEYLNLSNSALQWAEALLQYKNKIRKDNTKTVRESGYDINKIAKDMQQYYLSFR